MSQIADYLMRKELQKVILIDCLKCLGDRLLSQGYIALKLEKSFKKFYGRSQDLTEKYQRSVKEMVNDPFPG